MHLSHDHNPPLQSHQIRCDHMGSAAICSPDRELQTATTHMCEFTRCVRAKTSPGPRDDVERPETADPNPGDEITHSPHDGLECTSTDHPNFDSRQTSSDDTFAHGLHIYVPIEDLHENLRNAESCLSYEPATSEFKEDWRYLVGWMLEFGEDSGLAPRTTCLAIKLLAGLVLGQDVSRSRLQLVAATCMFIASKYSEIDERVPKLEKFRSSITNTYTRDLFHKMEKGILDHFGWNVSLVTPCDFVDYYLAVSRQSIDGIRTGLVSTRRLGDVEKKLDDITIFYLSLCVAGGTVDSYSWFSNPLIAFCFS